MREPSLPAAPSLAPTPVPPRLQRPPLRLPAPVPGRPPGRSQRRLPALTAVARFATSRVPGLVLALALLGGLALPAVPATAQEPAAALPVAAGEPVELVVGTKEAPPFAMRDPETGRWSGLSIELWRGVAADLGVAYELVETDLEGLLAGLEDGSLDVAAAALTITAEREVDMDFSHPFHSSGLGIAVAAEGGGGAWSRVRGLFSAELWKVLAALVLVLVVIGSLVWMFERRANAEEFGGGVLSGLGQGFWWSAVTMTTVGYGDKSPRTVAGRLVALVWMFASVVLISGFTAAIASSLTVASLELPVEGPEDLPRVTAATVPGSTSAAYLAERGVRSEGFGDLDAALAAVARGEPVALVYDAPILRYRVRRDHPESLQVLAATFEPQSYAFGLPAGSPWREAINRSLLERTSRPEWRARVERYLGEP